MMLTYIICTLIIGMYFFLILLFIIGFDNVNKPIGNRPPQTHFSIIIPFRNEAKRLPHLLASIATIEYRKNLFEVILVDDDSSDDSIKLINNFCADNPDIDIQLLNNIRSSNSPKKDAISIAIPKAKYDWIVSTDADCVLPPLWLTSFNTSIIVNKPNMLVAPVSFKCTTSFLAQFQLTDFLSMQGATIGGFGIQQPFMANGANLAYRKDLFLTLNGFEDNNFIASGDDVFLLENFIAYDKTKVLFLKNTEALVTTFPTNTWTELIQQRKRWAAKATHFKNPFAKGIGVVVFLANCIVVFSFIMGFRNLQFLWLLIPKIIIDTILIYKTARLYQEQLKSISYLKTVILYSFFTAFIAVSSMFGSFEWKERSFKK